MVGGAAAWFGAASALRMRHPEAHVATRWSREDEDLLGTGSPCPCEVESASSATRSSGGTHCSACARIVNEIAMEIAMLLAPMGLSTQGMHIWGVDSKLADAWSRFSQGAPLPAVLAPPMRSIRSESVGPTVGSSPAAQQRYPNNGEMQPRQARGCAPRARS